MLQGIAAAHVTPRAEDLTARGFSSHRKRRGKEESWGEIPAPCLSLCLPALLVSFDQAVPPREPAVEVS